MQLTLHEAHTEMQHGAGISRNILNPSKLDVMHGDIQA